MVCEAKELLLVRMRGLEPPRCHHHRLLRPARLPVPPHPHETIPHYANASKECQEWVMTGWCPILSSAKFCVLGVSAVDVFYTKFTTESQRNAEIAQRSSQIRTPPDDCLRGHA